MTDPHGGAAAEHGGEDEVCGRNHKKGKRVFRFRVKKVHKRNKLPNTSSKSSKSSKSCCFVGNKREGIGFGGCCVCFGQTPSSGVVGSPVESQESDPNSSMFTFDLLRSLIEQNDFFDKDCNTHLD